jgi:hypothetical protein
MLRREWGFCLPQLAVLLAASCSHPSSGTATPPDAAPEATPRPSASHVSPSPLPPSRDGGAFGHLPAPCRAAGVEGTVTAFPLTGGADAGAAVQASVGVPDDVWMQVTKGSRLTTRDSVSTRETGYVGPGRFRVCIDHREESWVQSGVFESVGGAGERPGGEEWVATPLGSARYDVVKWKLMVSEKSVLVQVQSGTGYFWPAEGVTAKFSAEKGTATPSMNDQGWVRLDGHTEAVLTVTRPVLDAEGAGAAIAQCKRMAGEAKSIATQLGEADVNVGELGPKHVVARRQAHAACEVAHLRVASLPPSPAKDAELGQVLAAEADWKALAAPAPGSPPP